MPLNKETKSCLTLHDHYIRVNIKNHIHNQNMGDGIQDYENLLKLPCFKVHDDYIGVNVP